MTEKTEMQEYADLGRCDRAFFNHVGYLVGSGRAISYSRLPGHTCGEDRKGWISHTVETIRPIVSAVAAMVLSGPDTPTNDSLSKTAHDMLSDALAFYKENPDALQKALGVACSCMHDEMETMYEDGEDFSGSFENNPTDYN